MALIIGSVFYNLQENTGSFYSRSALIFFAILMNAFGSALEVSQAMILQIASSSQRKIRANPE